VDSASDEHRQSSPEPAEHGQQQSRRISEERTVSTRRQLGLHTVRYQRIVWHHELEDEPVVLYSEIDDDGVERRKVDAYRDGTLHFADHVTSTGSTRLSDQPMPSLAEITAQAGFDGEAIDGEEFARVWRRATSQ
jgi:hypothetical protein